MTTKPENPQAYPRPFSLDAWGDHSTPQDAQEGMSLRDYFAARADIPWNAIIATLELRGEKDITVERMCEYRAELKYIEADAMLRARAA